MKFFKLAVMSLLAAVAAISFADNSPAASTPSATSAPATAAALSPQDEKLKKLVEQRLGEGAKVDTVTKTNYMGLYEVKVGDEILYTDEQAKYLMVGHVVDLETHKDLTSARLNEINKINFADLPFDSSIKMVHGNGKRVIAVFEDPNCHFCKNMRHTLASMDNVTVYTFMYNILSPDSAVKSKNVWCTPNRVKAWDDWMLGGKQPPAASAACTSNPNEQILALGHKLNITGTPTIFFTDGTRVPGAMESAALEEKWSSLQ